MKTFPFTTFSMISTEACPRLGRYTVFLLLALCASAQRRTDTSPAIPSMDTALLRGNWIQVVKSTDDDRALPPAVAKLLKAHGLLALNRSDESACLFASVATAGEKQQWETWSRRWLSRHPESALAYYLEGDALARLGQRKEALQAFQDALERNPNYALALNARAVVYASSGDWLRALADLQSASAVDNRLADLYLNKGYAYIQRRVPSGARRAFEQALRLVPDSALARGGMGYVQIIENRWADGRPKLQEAASACKCLADLIAANLVRVEKSLDQQNPLLLANAKPEEVGNTINSLLMKLGTATEVETAKGYAKQVLSLGAQDPTGTEKKLQLTFDSMSKTNPIAKQAIGQAINEFTSASEQQDQAIQALKGVKVSGKIGGSANGLTAELGASADLGQSLEQQGKLAAQRVALGQNLQGTVQSAKDQAGGVTTSLETARFDKGDWLLVPHYTLMYPMASEIALEKGR